MEHEAAQEPQHASLIQDYEAHSNFISMLAHELRTPLHTVNGFLSLVLEEHVGTLNERQREFLEYAHIGAEQLMTLVDDLLLLSRLDHGRFTLHCAALELPDLIAQALRRAEPAALKAQVTLYNQATEDFPALWADAGYLQQALVKLLYNALRCTPPGGTISLVARQAGEVAEISITDTSPGVPQEDQPRIFERFYQSAHPLLAKHGSFGLDLPVVKAVVEQHGGRIWLQSAPEHGATFAFTIPLFIPQKHQASMLKGPTATEGLPL